MRIKEIATYSLGFCSGIVLSCFVATISLLVCDWYCDKMLEDMLTDGAVIIVPDATLETRP